MSISGITHPSAIRSRGWDGEYVLVHKNSNVIFPIGAEVTLRDNEVVLLNGGRAPHKPESQGKVWVNLPGHTSIEYYASVIGARWVRVRDDCPTCRGRRRR